jgi:hypothetical protein
VPDKVRAVVGKLPTNDPVTIRTYPVGAPPLADGAHAAVRVLPLLTADNRVGTEGGVQTPGKLRVTVFEAGLTPVPLNARTANVYVPSGTPTNANCSDTGKGIDVE